MNLRVKLIQEMQLNCCPGSYLDFCVIANRLEREYSREEVLNLPALLRWPDSLTWLSDRL